VTFIKVVNCIKSYKPEFKFSSWSFKVANNTAIDYLRKRSVETLSLEGAPNSNTPYELARTALQIDSGAESPLEEVEARELGSAIERAIGRLRPEYRACIVLRHVEGYAYEQIADILELPLGTVKTYIHRARNELRVALEQRRA
jgi:RNA polymerase sigma-70 factor (ECF subfamily)